VNNPQNTKMHYLLKICIHLCSNWSI